MRPNLRRCPRVTANDAPSATGRSSHVTSNCAPAIAIVVSASTISSGPISVISSVAASSVVADQLVREPMRERVHRSGHRHAGRLMPVAAEVLHRRQQAGLDDDAARRRSSISRRHEPHEIARGEQARLDRGRDRTSPSSVWPISCQPPGLSTGYTPVCNPAMPTEPAGTRSRGTRWRGAAIDGSTRPM